MNTISKMKLSVLKGSFTVHQFPPDHRIPNRVYTSEFFTISKTADELSIVCGSAILLTAKKSEPDWSCLKIEGPLDFSLKGILADISAVLSKANISIFAMSTFDTDYILVKSKELSLACNALEASGHTIER